MVKHAYRKLFILLSSLVLANCNIEVGNPEDGSGGLGRAQSFNSLQMNLTSMQACETTTADCTAVPVRAAGLPEGYTFEMTQASLQLDSVAIAPYGSEQVFTRVDLLKGTTIEMAQSYDAALVTSLSLSFSARQNVASSYTLAGNLVVPVSGSRSIIIPLEISYEQPLAAATAVNAESSVIEALQFDANSWFDFTGANLDFAQLLKRLVSGACTDLSARSCLQVKDVLARRISDSISRSLSVKTAPADQKMTFSGRAMGK